MYIREHKGKWRFAECYPDPLTGKKREVSIVLDKNTPQTRKEASIALQEKIREKTCSTCPESMRLSELVDKFVNYQRSMRKESTAYRLRCPNFQNHSAGHPGSTRPRQKR